MEDGNGVGGGGKVWVEVEGGEAEVRASEGARRAADLEQGKQLRLVEIARVVAIMLCEELRVGRGGRRAKQGSCFAKS